LRVWSLAEPEQSEAEIIQRFFDGIEKFTPQIVSWNGGGFDLPVLHYRGLIHGVSRRATGIWATATMHDSRDFKWNNYISRYHTRHLDLMDLLAMYQPRANAPLDDLAKLMGFPGKLGMDGSKVWEAWQNGEIAGIRDYCETDVMNTYLVFAAFRGELMRIRRRSVSCEASWRGYKPHWHEFLAAWTGV
jgi:predicted PolB exonuclease-like 3'-5' exonuclease